MNDVFFEEDCRVEATEIIEKVEDALSEYCSSNHLNYDEIIEVNNQVIQSISAVNDCLRGMR